MKKLGFLVGKWAGEARLQRGPGEPVVLVQTEEAQFKLDGLILEIEGLDEPSSTTNLFSKPWESSPSTTRRVLITCARSMTAAFWRRTSSF